MQKTLTILITERKKWIDLCESIFNDKQEIDFKNSQDSVKSKNEFLDFIKAWSYFLEISDLVGEAPVREW